MTTGKYPRDLFGYGPNPPDPQWPGGARVALNLVINYEEGAEHTIMDGDAHSEGLMTDVPGHPTFQAREGKRNLLVESMYEYGSRAGIWRILRLFDRYDVRCTVYACGQAMERNPIAAKAMADAGHEIATHGYRWIDHGELTVAEERDHMRRAIEAIANTTGKRPVGWFAGRMSMISRRLAAEEGGFIYDSDSYADDLPYWVEDSGYPVLVLPYSLEVNDMRFTVPGGFTEGTQFFNYMRDTFDFFYEEGATRPRMMSVGLHPRVVGRPGRARALQKFLEHVRQHDDVWICTREEIARHWRERFPYEAQANN